MSTLATLRQRLGAMMGVYETFTTDAAGATDGTTLVYTKLEYDNEALRDRYVIVTPSSTAEVRKIQSNYHPTGKVHPYVPFSAQVASSKAVELWMINPSNITTYINDALRDAYPKIAKVIFDDSLVTGNILPNSNFTDWATTTYPDYWSAATATAAESTTNPPFGTSILYLSGAAGSLYISSDTYPALKTLEGCTITMYAWVLASDEDAARIGVYCYSTDGETDETTYSDYHTGGGEWELLSVDVEVPDGLGEIKPGLYITDNYDCYFSNVRIPAEHHQYVLPTDIDQICQLIQCNDADEWNVVEGNFLDFEIENHSGTKYINIPDYVVDSKARIKGYGPYAALSADTDTIGLTTEEERVILKGAAALFLEGEGAFVSRFDNERVSAMINRYRREFRDGIENHATIKPPIQIRRTGAVYE